LLSNYRANYQDDHVLQGEDHRSIERHLEDINVELAKLRPDFAVINEKIRATLVTRSKIIEEPLNTVLAKFPWLMNPQIGKFAVVVNKRIKLFITVMKLSFSVQYYQLFHIV
jgi:hypothetical protein